MFWDFIHVGGIYYYIVQEAGLEPAITDSKSVALPTWLFLKINRKPSAKRLAVNRAPADMEKPLPSR